MLNPFLQLERVAPPYIDSHPIESLAAWAPGKGEVVLVRILDPDRVTTAYLQLLTNAIAVDYAVTIGLKLTAVDSLAAVRLSAHAYAIGLRAVITDGNPLARTLHTLLSSPHDPAYEVVHWLKLRGHVHAQQYEPVYAICRAAYTATSLTQAYSTLRVSPRTLRDQLDRGQLPNPERWYQLMRLIGIQLRMIREPDLSLHAASRMVGYVDPQSLDNALHRVFGVSAARARRLLGIEWRLDAWWNRIGGVHPSRHETAGPHVAPVSLPDEDPLADPPRPTN